MKVDGSLKSLLQGVSQQPPRDRLAGQCTLQENMSSDPVSGLTRRPSTDLVGLLVDSTRIYGWHDLDTKSGAKFLAVFYHDKSLNKAHVQVFDMNGTKIATQVDENARAYIAYQNGDLRFNTLDNDTFVVNNKRIVNMKTGFYTYFNNNNRDAYIIQVLGGQYAREYTIKVDGVKKASYTTRDGSSASHSPDVSTANIATKLVASLEQSDMKDNGWSWRLQDDIILLWKNNAPTAHVNVTVSDGYGNTTVKVNGITITNKEYLPRMAPHNFVVRVTERTDPEMDLWFKFIADGMENSSAANDPAIKAGYWQETVAPNTSMNIDEATMPHILELIEDNPITFKFRRATWKPRRVGTLQSNPNPSFIHDRINDVFTFQSRLGFLSGPNVIMSRSNHDDDFWFSSVAQQASSDPIDVRSKVEASIMQAAIQHNRDLVIFSNKGQFIMTGRSQLTPDNAALVLTSSFDAELQAKPVGAGRNVFFATNYGAYTGIREYFAEGGTDINDSRDITQHVKRYVQGRATKLTASSNYDTMLVHTDDNDRALYWYQYIWKDNEKVQSSWSKLEFGMQVVHTFFDEEQVYLVMRDKTEYYLIRMSLDIQPEPDVGYHVYLDERFDVGNPQSGVHKQFYLPYAFLADKWKDKLILVQGSGCPTPGLIVPIKSVVKQSDGRWLVTLLRDMEGGVLIGGRRFVSKYMPTMPMVKDENGTVVGTGNFVITRFRVSLSETGEVIGQVKSKYGDQYPVRFNGRLVGDIHNQVGVQPLSNEQFLLPFNMKSNLAEVALWTDSHLPMTFLDIEWDGQYTKRGRRITTGD